jgi:hypothetical protein
MLHEDLWRGLQMTVFLVYALALWFGGTEVKKGHIDIQSMFKVCFEVIAFVLEQDVHTSLLMQAFNAVFFAALGLGSAGAQVVLCKCDSSKQLEV